MNTYLLAFEVRDHDSIHALSMSYQTSLNAKNFKQIDNFIVALRSEVPMPYENCELIEVRDNFGYELFKKEVA